MSKNIPETRIVIKRHYENDEYVRTTYYPQYKCKLFFLSWWVDFSKLHITSLILSKSNEWFDWSDRNKIKHVIDLWRIDWLKTHGKKRTELDYEKYPD